MIRSTGTSGSIRSRSLPARCMAARIAARSSAAGTPVESCSRMRAGRKGTDVPLGGLAGYAAGACGSGVPAGATGAPAGRSGGARTPAQKRVNRLIEPTSGSVLIDGRDVRTGDAVALRRGIGYVIQQIGLFPHRTVAQNVA